eukprot:1078944-Prymnesium_polylepis.1
MLPPERNDRRGMQQLVHDRAQPGHRRHHAALHPLARDHLHDYLLIRRALLLREREHHRDH